MHVELCCVEFFFYFCSILIQLNITNADRFFPFVWNIFFLELMYILLSICTYFNAHTCAHACASNYMYMSFRSPTDLFQWNKVERTHTYTHTQNVLVKRIYPWDMTNAMKDKHRHDWYILMCTQTPTLIHQNNKKEKKTQLHENRLIAILPFKTLLFIDWTLLNTQ